MVVHCAVYLIFGRMLWYYVVACNWQRLNLCAMLLVVLLWLQGRNLRRKGRETPYTLKTGQPWTVLDTNTGLI